MQISAECSSLLPPSNLDKCVVDESPYEILGIPRSATEEQVRGAYRAQLEHCASDLTDSSRWQLVTDAYEILCRPERRAAYDACEAAIKARHSSWPGFKEEPSGHAGRWLLWLMFAVGAATAIYAWRCL